MKRFAGFVAVAMVLTGGLWLDAQEAADPEARRHVEKAAGFSFVPPEGWTAREFPGLKYQIVLGPPEGGFAPNINVVDEAFEGTLEDYVKATLQVLPKAFKKYQLIKQEEFKTTAGLAGTRVIVEHEQQDNLLRQTFYIFSGSKRMFVVTCTALSAGGEKLDPVFEGSLKSFRFDTK